MAAPTRDEFVDIIKNLQEEVRLLKLQATRPFPRYNAATVPDATTCEGAIIYRWDLGQHLASNGALWWPLYLPT